MTTPDGRTSAKLLVVTVGAPHPDAGASAVVFWHYIDALRRAGWRIRHVLLGVGTQAAAEYAQRIGASADFEIDAVEATASIGESLFGLSLDVSAIEPALARARGFAPDALLAFDLPAAWAFESVPSAKRAIWAGDLMFDVVRYHAIYAANENWRLWPHSLLRLVVAYRWRAVYRRVLGAMDTVIASSHSSVAKLAAMGVDSSFQPYPWPGPQTPAVHRPPKTPTFAFFGNLSALGSRSALHFAFERVIPLLRQAWGAGGFEIQFAGTGKLPAWAQEAFDRTPEAKLLGFVADLGAVVGGAHAVIAPIDVPVGNRTRILTALAYSVPVVAHTNSALGNPDLVDGVTCYLAADPDQFAKQMLRVVENPGAAAKVAARGRQTYLANYAPERACAAFIAALDALKPRSEAA